MMKQALFCSALLMLLYTVLIDAQSSTTSDPNSSNSRPRLCVLWPNCNLNSVNNVCGRYGRSNLCKRFKNSCLLLFEACVNSVAYTPVPLSMCSGIPVGTRRRCAGTSTSTLTSS
ncbi:hypothetical protein KR093_008771 [Drosophila rubida]|uniref:Uncharacterized protein n=1 Tax=Drosophila rubida TaxID=30044 RepID=A0AAD4K894_9MUSC|nr:hypothetical protein KR093_008771 [Drosophila rubida]